MNKKMKWLTACFCAIDLFGRWGIYSETNAGYERKRNVNRLFRAGIRRG